MERLWGRIYDDIKREISVIKNMNNVTYDEKSNAPDYFLTDFVENSGFEPKTLDLTMDNDETTSTSTTTFSPKHQNRHSLCLSQ